MERQRLPSHPTAPTPCEPRGPSEEVSLTSLRARLKGVRGYMASLRNVFEDECYADECYAACASCDSLQRFARALSLRGAPQRQANTHFNASHLGSMYESMPRARVRTLNEESR